MKRDQLVPFFMPAPIRTCKQFKPQLFNPYLFTLRDYYLQRLILQPESELYAGVFERIE